MKTMREPRAVAMMLESEEIDILRKADAILQEVQMKLGGDNVIMSLETGECIVPGDLANARGVLGFVSTYRVVEINPE